MVEIGNLIATARTRQNVTQAELAEMIGTSQSAINRIEHGKQNASLEIISKISKALEFQIISVNDSATQGYRIDGGHRLHGSITINTSKNAAVGLLCAALLNEEKTTLNHLAHIEEVYRIIEVLDSIGVKTEWVNNGRDLEIVPPKRLEIEKLDIEAARRTRTVIMLMGPLLHYFNKFQLPYAGGCSLGSRTVEPHLHALKNFGLDVDAISHSGFYSATVKPIEKGDRKIVLTERGDTVTENAIMAAALCPGKTTIVGASPNYMVQDVCFYLQKLGVQIDGVGTTNITVHGVERIAKEIEYAPGEDPIEAIEKNFDKNWKNDLKHWCEPNKHHHKRYCFKFIMDRVGSQSVERHRGVWGISYAQESTRFVNYNKDKFDKSIMFSLPSKFYELIDKFNTEETIKRTWPNYTSLDMNDWSLDERLSFLRNCSDEWNIYEKALKQAEKSYMMLSDCGWKPQDARGVLNLDIKTEFMMCAYKEDWKMWLFRRLDKHAHPHIIRFVKMVNDILDKKLKIRYVDKKLY